MSFISENLKVLAIQFRGPHTVVLVAEIIYFLKFVRVALHRCLFSLNEKARSNKVSAEQTPAIETE